MLWITLSFLTAVATASQDAWVKRYFSHLSAAEMTAFPFLYSFPLFAMVLPFVPVPALDRAFYWSFILSIPLHIVPFFLHSSPLFFTVSFFCFLGVAMTVAMLIFGKARPGVFREDVGRGVIAGCLLFAHAVFHGFAISLTKAAYMISVKRLSVLIGFGYGWLIFKEKDIPVRLIGTVLMVGGAALITLRGN